MATPKDTMPKVIDAKEVKKLLTWVRREVKAEQENVLGESTRLIKIEYEIDRVLRKYSLI